jgi:hypothetical protein
MRLRGWKADAVMWMTLLSECRHFKNLTMAERAFGNISRLGDSETLACAYVLMASVFKACDDMDSASRFHAERLNRGLNKVRGAVTLTLNGSCHVFHYRSN